jgi:hypothetical protein
LWLGAGPRVTPVSAAERERSSQPRAVRTAPARESAADNAATVPDGDAGPPRSTARSGSPDSVANAGHPGGKTRCNNDSAVGWADRTARSLSAGNDGDGIPVPEQRALAEDRSQRNTEEGPRELSLPKVTSRGERLLAPRHSRNQLHSNNPDYFVGKRSAKT